MKRVDDLTVQNGSGKVNQKNVGPVKEKTVKECVSAPNTKNVGGVWCYRN